MANPEVHVPDDPAYKAEEVLRTTNAGRLSWPGGEMKTDMLGQAMTLRSQQPDGGQELWATLLMYNLIR